MEFSTILRIFLPQVILHGGVIATGWADLKLCGYIFIEKSMYKSQQLSRGGRNGVGHFLMISIQLLY